MGHLATFESITLHITTDQSTTHFTIETIFPGVVNHGFNETSPGLYSHNGTAHNGSFTEILLPFGDNGGPNIAVLNDGQFNQTERRKGVFIEAETGHELTVYATGYDDTPIPTIGTYMAIACVNFNVEMYQYFVFTLPKTTNNQILITPCEDITTVSVRPSQVFSHPDWVNPSHTNTDPTSINGQDLSVYGHLFNRFDTLMLSSEGDLTGSIIISDKPLSVLVRSHGVVQIPPHPTYGDLFILTSISEQTIIAYTFGSLTDGVRLSFSCNCTPPNIDSAGGGSEVVRGNYTAAVNRGQYVQCFLPTELDMCIVQSNQPVTLMLETVRPLVTTFYTPSMYSLLINGHVSLLGNVKPEVESATFFNAFLFWFEKKPSDKDEVSCSRSIRSDSEADWIYFCSQELFNEFENFMHFGNTRTFGGGVTLQYISQYGFQPLPLFSLPFKMDPVGCKYLL